MQSAAATLQFSNPSCNLVTQDNFITGPFPDSSSRPHNLDLPERPHCRFGAGYGEANSSPKFTDPITTHYLPYIFTYISSKALVTYHPDEST